MTDPEWMQLKSIALHVEGEEVPAPWPDGASAEYGEARRALERAQAELLEKVRTVAALRRDLPPGAVVEPVTLTEGPADLAEDGPDRPVTLLDLFGDHESLVVYHLMFHPDDDQACPMCSMWVDGLHGVSHHLSRRTAFAVVAKAPVGKLRRWGRHRGWQGLRLVSSHGTSFNTDLHVEGAAGGQWPAVSVFARERDGSDEDDRVRHVLTQSADGPAGGIDLLNPVWHVWDLLPAGRGDWFPDNDYPGAERGGR
jgi:predicted dithiol-disulfide oxidoreductase (DUF899 family)